MEINLVRTCSDLASTVLAGRISRLTNSVLSTGDWAYFSKSISVLDGARCVSVQIDYMHLGYLILHAVKDQSSILSQRSSVTCVTVS